MTHQPLCTFVGIDVAADSFVASIYTGINATEAPRTAAFANDQDGFEVFAEWLSTHGARLDCSIICLEDTGVYSEALCHDIYRRGLPLAVEDPLRVQRAFKTSANKTDPTDAQQIAEYAYRYEDQLRFWEPPEAIVEHVRVLLRAREQFSRDLVAKKNLLKTTRRKEVRTPFAEEMLEASIRELKAKTRRIRDEIWRLVRTDRQLTETMMLLRSIPGVGPVLSAHLLVTTNAFQRTPTSRQLAAFIGICPYKHQSGTSVQKQATSRRYGPPVLRKLLYLAALTLKKYVPRFEHYYLRKRAEGKPPKLILNNMANKLVRIICAVLRDRQPYYETHRSVNPNLLQAG